MATQIKTGSVVRLKSGGPNMTVASIEPAANHSTLRARTVIGSSRTNQSRWRKVLDSAPCQKSVAGGHTGAKVPMTNSGA
ncbi:DUF2158 domain-containing protein [Mesorhizobium sp. LjNodule214]|uniref:DUF2158 domain-containing protein n=1 Tax=Mesorhizobium sp. LjNodule214 TaxID=3342252 RepID=UPI003F50B13E